MKSTSSTSLLLHLVSLTALRDLELMEFSLLQTLSSFLLPQSISLVHLDMKGHPCKELIYANQKFDVRSEDIHLSKEVHLARKHLALNPGEQYIANIDGGYLIIISLITTQYTHSLLLIHSDHMLSTSESYMVSGVLRICTNFFELLHHSQTDKLTGLANRQTFDECVSRVCEMIPQEKNPILPERRHDRPLGYWLAIIDIDHFKSVNDRFGHLYGDEVLVLLAQKIKASFREDDMLFRFGGEEFIVIIRCPDHLSCYHTLDRFRLSVENSRFPQVGKVTVSIGATRMTRDTFIATLLDYADQALYHSKRNGRNQTTFFEDLLTVGLAKPEEIIPGNVELF